jgi:predicted DNA-binding ribbon-helix-helix protein
MAKSRFKNKSPIVKRSVVIKGHKTSVSLEEPFWRHLGVIAERRGVPVSNLVATIDGERTTGNLSSTLRIVAFSDVLGLPVSPALSPAPKSAASNPAVPNPAVL